MHFRWLRNFVRRHTNQIPEERADFWKRRLSLVYMLVAWNAFGLVAYMIYKGKGDWAKEHKTPQELRMTPAQQWATTLGIKEAKVFRISGAKVSKYDINNDLEQTAKTGNEALKE